jgi:hypothetical protein
MLTARLLTNCSITQRNILTPERISQVPEREYHRDTCKLEAGYFFVAHSVYESTRAKVTNSVYLKMAEWTKHVVHIDRIN